MRNYFLIETAFTHQKFVFPSQEERISACGYRYRGYN